MGAKYKEYGGGPATGLADNFIQFLSQGLNTGSFGAGQAAGGDAMGQTQGIAGVLNDILSGGAGNLGGSMAQLIRNDTTDQVNQMRARFGASGGTAYGTGAQYGEGVLRSKQAPALTTAVGNLQMGAIQNLMGIMANLSGKGIAQRQGVMEENSWMTGLQIGAKLAEKGAMAFANPGAAAASTMADTNALSQMPGMSGPLPGMQLTPNMAAQQMASPNFGWTPTLFDYGLTKPVH
jgi:hypothetical protein